MVETVRGAVASHYFRYRGPNTLAGGPELLEEMFLRDIREGIGGTGVKAAFLECVVEEHGLRPDQTRVQQAVCAVHRETGIPITVHTNAAARVGGRARRLGRLRRARRGPVDRRAGRGERCG